MPAKKATSKKAAKSPAAKPPKDAAAKQATKAAARKAVEKLATKKVDGLPTAAPATPSAPTAHRKSVPTKLKAARETSANPPSLQTVQEMAYLNYLHRSRHGLPGDAMSDWIAAIDSLNQSDRTAAADTLPVSAAPKKPRRQAP
jgi:hypothetical protein